MHKFLFSSTLVTLFVCFTSSFGMSQNMVNVTGQVKDMETKENLPYCKVVALNNADTVVTGGITDDKGFFKLPLPPGQYKLIVSFYGYSNDTTQTGVLREDTFLGVVKMKADVMNVDEVKVEASSYIDQLDKDIQIITEKEKLGATAAKDVLDKITGVSYDDYSGVLKIDNDANIMILVNGVEKSQEYIQNLEPERLLRVEITRNPGGRYGLEGYTAILNVVLKNDYKGTEVYLEQMNLVDVNTEQSRLDYMIGSFGGTYNYTKNNLNIYASGKIERKKFLIATESETRYGDSTVVFERSDMAGSNTKILEYSAWYTLGMDYRINPKHVISFESNLGALPLSTDDNVFSYQTEVYSNDTLMNKYRFNTRTKTQKLNSYNSLFYIGDFNERNKLNLNYTYSYYKDNYSATSAQEAGYDRLENGDNLRQYSRFYAEWDHIFSAKWTVQLGYGNTWRKLKNVYDVSQYLYTTDENVEYSSQFQLSDFRNKLYTNVSWKISKKWGARIGIAAENSAPKASGEQFYYIIYQPMFDLRYAAGKKLNLQLKYRTSSAYPSIGEVNPFVSKINPRMTSTGNPFLKPSTTHEFSLRINAFQGMLAVEPYVHYSNNIVAKVGELGSDNIFNFHYENVKLYQRNGVKANFSKYFKFSVLLQANLEVYQSRIVSSSKVNNQMDWRGDVDLIYIFPKSQTLIGLKYQRQQSKSISGLGYDKGDVDFWMLFYKQPLFKKRASIMFGYFLPLNFGAQYNQGSYIETSGLMMRTNNNVSLVKNMFILEFSYRFSKGKSVKKNEKNIQKEKEENGGGIF